MPRYYCDYCDSYLTHDSAPGRQQHIRGWKHRENFRQYYQTYYQQFVAAQQRVQHESMVTAQYLANTQKALGNQSSDMQICSEVSSSVPAPPVFAPPNMPFPPMMPGMPPPMFMPPPGAFFPGAVPPNSSGIPPR